MSSKALAWALLFAMAIAAVLLLNYWASFQPLSTLVYFGIVLAFAGLANLVLPFRFLGVRKRAVGAMVLLGGGTLAYAALSWPAPTVRVAQRATRLDEIMPEYQFSEKHSTRIHARREQVMQAIRQSTFGDMTSLITLLKIRGAAMRTPSQASGFLYDMRILDAFAKSGYLMGDSDREIVIAGAFNVRAQRRADVHTLQQFADCREHGAIKMGYGFNVEDAGGGWSTVTTETRVMALDDSTSRGAARYWRLIVPGSGLLRLQWLEGIKRRAEGAPSQAS